MPADPLYFIAIDGDPRGEGLSYPHGAPPELQTVARAAGVPVAEEICQAITGRIEERRQNEEFRARLRKSIEDNQRMLDRLAQ